jgi:hypothetical protein
MQRIVCNVHARLVCRIHISQGHGLTQCHPLVVFLNQNFTILAISTLIFNHRSISDEQINVIM